ncbi:MAG TPA: S16 family serine protease [Rubrobacteraceae bacterium]|nr:S16 family serine protease [Rubrobacteraceae bacterium]
MPGDLLLLSEGDRLSADARLIDGSVEVDVSPLTGESQPVVRSATRSRSASSPLESDDLVFSGTLVTAGEAESVVYTTGMGTQLGRIAALTQRVRGETSPLQRQVNGLSVLQLGNFAFGHPSRITARVRMGKGEVVDIEREVELGGPLHSKGVLILSGFLGARYAAERPLSLSASLVFEQSYGGVEGDSASSAELYALLSAISGLPIRQSLAVTGSVNQHGQVQAIGGVNEKIEGFFDVCRARGLTGEQGVLILASNVKYLMLREDVVSAVEQGRFHVYPVETVDEGIEVLTGTPAGERDAAGKYPEGSVNGLVEARLAALTEKQARFGRTFQEGGPE